MKYLLISNLGEIEVKAFTKIGYSSKVGDSSKIGEFGSGLNYAIAWLMRNNIKFKAYSGKREIIFEIVKSCFRGNDIDVIQIDGTETSFCLTLGGDKWKPWMAIREIYCNALDEQDAQVNIVDDLNPEHNETRFYIEIDSSIQEVIDNWDTYFSKKREDLLLSEKGFKLFKGGDKLIVYRKGIRCFTYDAPSMFHYDLDEIKINESRIVEDTWELDRSLVSILAGKLSPELKKEFIEKMNDNKTYESKLNWEWYGSYYYDSGWKEALKGKKITESKFYDDSDEKHIPHKNVIIVPGGMARALVDKGVQHAGGRMANEIEDTFEVELNSDDKASLGAAARVLQSMGYLMPARSLKKFIYKGNKIEILSYSIKNTIYLNSKLFNFRLSDFVVYIIKENERIISGIDMKETHQFETYLAKRIFHEIKNQKHKNHEKL